MCFDGPARNAAHEMWCTTATTMTTSTVPMRPPKCLTGRPGPWPMRCGVLLLQLRVFFVWLSRYPPKTATFVRCISGKSPRGANVGSKAWYRCGCTDDTPCRLGDAGSMTFLPWSVPRTEPLVQLREVGPGRGHLLTEVAATFTFMCVDVEPGMRTAAAVAWGAAAKISLLVLALSLLGVAAA